MKKFSACGIPNTLQHQTDFRHSLLIPSEVKGMPSSEWEFSKIILPVVAFAYLPSVKLLNRKSQNTLILFKVKKKTQKTNQNSTPWKKSIKKLWKKKQPTNQQQKHTFNGGVVLRKAEFLRSQTFSEGKKTWISK